MIRRSFLTLFFVVLLMFGQQQAMVHAYIHTADLQQKSAENKSLPNHTEVCGKCVSLAGLGAALSSQAATLNIISGQFQLSTQLHQSIISQRVLAYHSRAPPILS